MIAKENEGFAEGDAEKPVTTAVKEIAEGKVGYVRHTRL
jgi:DNA-directed RNA polymerase subunit K/omega